MVAARGHRHAAGVKRLSPTLCPREAEAPAPALAAFLRPAGGDACAGSDSPAPLSREAARVRAASTGEAEAAAGGCAGRAALCPLQTHTCAWAQGPDVGNRSRVLMISALMPSAGAIYSR